MVKNEEKYLEKCLNSIIPILNNLDSELIIVDTGSEDKTVEIAKRYTDKVYFHNWNNNFSEIRNNVLSYCTGEWFFCIDGDEVLEDCNDIISFFKSLEYKNYNSASIYVKNLVNLKDENDYSILSAIRLFNKDMDFKYINAVHNQPLYKEPTKALKTKCKHYGYISTDKELMEKKYRRTVTILQDELKKDPNNIYYLCQLSISYAMHDDYIEAINCVQKAYVYISRKEEYKKIYSYVYLHLCLCYFNIKDYINVEKYGRECLRYDKSMIDIYFFLAISLISSKKNEEAIIAFESYLKLYEEHSIMGNNVGVISYTLGRIDEVYYKLYILNRDIKEYVKAKKYLLSITNSDYDIPQNIVELCLSFKEYSDIKKYEENLLLKNEINTINKLHMHLENAKLKMNFEEANILTKVFSFGDLAYNRLNKIRLRYENDENVDGDEINLLLKNVDLSSEPFYFGDLIYYTIHSKYNLVNITKYLVLEKINEFLKYLVIKHQYFNEVAYNYILDFVHDDNFYLVRINKELCRYLILLNKLEQDKLQNIFMCYIDLGIKYMKYVYSEFILENDYWQVTRTQEEKFFIYINKAKDYKTIDEKIYIKYLRMALEAYPCMKDMILYLIEKQKNSSSNSELEQYKIQIKYKIKDFIENGDLCSAEELINEYEEIVKNDAEIYSIKGVVSISKGDLDEAEKVLKQGLGIDNNNFDLFYNLGYLYNIQNRKIEALAAYTVANLICNNDQNKELTKKEILSLEGIKTNAYNVIFCGNVEHCIDFEKVFEEWNVIGYVVDEKGSKYNEKVIQINNIKNYNYDFIMIVDEHNENKILEKLEESGTNNNIYFYSNFKTSVIEGFDYRIRELLSKNNIEMIVTGSSYAEVGIKAEQLNKSTINFAFSSQDLYYDYQIVDYLLEYGNVKNSIKYVILGLSYYCFDYDMSKSIAKYRIHRYKNYIKSFHNNSDEIGINITRAFYEKRPTMKEYCDMNKQKENTVIKYPDGDQEYISKKNSSMDYSMTRKENIDIFYKYLSLLKANNIRPIIVICPTSKYYYKYFNDCYQKNKFYEILNSFKKDFDFQVIDYFNSSLFEDNDFWDYGHLNGKGAEKFTEILNREII